MIWADLAEFAAEVGDSGPVTIAGTGSRGGPVPRIRPVMAPSRVRSIQPEEMLVTCGAGTPIAELDAQLSAHNQTTVLPPSGTVGGALAVGISGIRRLGYGPTRDCLLQARYVDAAGRLITAGGPTVKNVSGFDLCRLLVGSHGTLGFLGEVTIRTRPRADHEQWYSTDQHFRPVFARLYRPISVLWDGRTTHVLLAGHPDDMARQATALGLATSDPPTLPGPHRWSVPPATIDSLTGEFVAEVGVGIVHRAESPPATRPDPGVLALHDRIKERFDPTGRLNPGLDLFTCRHVI